MAIAETKPATRSNGGGLFGSLFASRSEPAAAEKSEGTFDRMKRLVGLRGADKDKAADAASKAKPAAEPTRVASHSTDPAEARRSRAREVRRSARSRDDHGLRQRRHGRRPAQAAPAVAPQKPASGSMTGAAPVVSSGNFDNRWSGFR